MEGKDRKVYFELLRVIACALVIFNHSGAYELYKYTVGVKQYIYMCLTMITRLNVPVFFMISGALLYEKDEEIKTVFRKRVAKVVLLLLFFEFVIVMMSMIRALINREVFEYTLYDFIYDLLKNDIAVPYWYLYSYMGVLVVLPLLQRLAKGLTKTEFWVLMGLHFLKSSLLPMLNILQEIYGIPSLTLSTDFQVPFAFISPYFYTLVGYYIEHNLDVKVLRIKHIVGMISIGTMGIVLSNFCTYYDATINGEYSQSYVQLFDYVTAIVTFILVKYIFIVVRPSLSVGKISKVICFFGSMTLGIYMLDPVLRSIFYKKYEAWAGGFLSTFKVSVGWIVISILLGSMITKLLKWIPGLKKII